MTKTSFSHGQLQALVDRIERLEEEKKAIAADVKEVYAAAKGNGFDVKILRKVISLRKKEAAEREEEQAMLDVYLTALGMQTNLFEDDREQVKKTAVRLRQEDTAKFAIEAAQNGLMSKESAVETIALAQQINNQFGDGKDLVLPEILETQSQTEVVTSEAVTEGNGESTPNANAMDANKTPSTHREVELPSSAPPPEPVSMGNPHGEAAEPDELSRDGLESSAADIGDIPEFLRRVA